MGEERIPEPAWRVRRKAANRLPLTREAIVDAALRVLDRDGLDRLSMRRVADQLGTGPASLYWHVRNKGELLQLLAERLTGELALPEPDPRRWREQLRELARAMRAQSLAHRDAARLTLGRVPVGPEMARTVEWTLRLLGPLGVPDGVVGRLGDLSSLFVTAFTLEESLGSLSPTGEPLPPAEILAMFRGYFESLPEDRFPNLRRAAATLFEGDADDRFEFGIDLLLRGLATYVEEVDGP